MRRAEFSLPRGFEAIELAGMGAFSEVWKAIEISTGRICALKRLRPGTVRRCHGPPTAEERSPGVPGCFQFSTC